MWRRVLQYILVATFVAGLVGTSALERPSTAAARNGRLVPATGALFGSWIERDTTTNDAYRAMYLGREAEIGRRFDTINHFYPFFADFPTWKETWDIQMGRIPMISWNGTNTAAIARGDYDALIIDRATGVKNLGVDTFMRWFWEMDGGESASIAISPSNYIAAWNRIRDIFTVVGATNAVWVWCPTSWGFEQGHAIPWYPGDSKVDWVCADGYNFAPTRDGAQWQTWEDVYRESHDFAVAHNKPLMAGEWGALERNSGEKGAWYDAARNTIKTSMPNIAAIVAFDERKWHDDENRFFDWEIDTSKTSFEAFQRWGRDSYFRTRTPLILPSVSAGDAVGWEADTADPTVTIPVTLSAPSPDTVTVTAQTVATTASATDFVAVNRTVKFNPGVTRVYVDVKLRADTLDEANEQVNLVLSNPSATAVLGDATGVATITDEDPAASGVRLYVSNGSISEGGSYDRTARLTISLNHDSPSTVSVKWTLSSTSAVRLTDWSGTLNGTMTFNPGQNFKTVTIKVHPDWHDEANENVTVTLSNPVGATIADSSGTLTISDDD
jgi:Calx-beta domain